ncbi:MAG: hypothetical protein V3Q69_13485 [Burkholderia sp.]
MPPRPTQPGPVPRCCRLAWRCCINRARAVARKRQWLSLDLCNNAKITLIS